MAKGDEREVGFQDRSCFSSWLVSRTLREPTKENLTLVQPFLAMTPTSPKTIQHAKCSSEPNIPQNHPTCKVFKRAQHVASNNVAPTCWPGLNKASSYSLLPHAIRELNLNSHFSSGILIWIGRIWIVNKALKYKTKQFSKAHR